MDQIDTSANTPNAVSDYQQTNVDPFSLSANPFAPENAGAENNANLLTGDLNNPSPVQYATSSPSPQAPQGKPQANPQPSQGISGSVLPAAAGLAANALIPGAKGSTPIQNILGGTATRLQAGVGGPSTIQQIQGDLGQARQVAGLVGQASQAGLFGDASSSVGSIAGDAGQALGYAAIPLDIYNFAQNWQSGATGSDALRGAETGAAIGSVIPGVGTIVGGLVGGAIGALSSAFGGGATDPETSNWNSYIKATGGATPNAAQMNTISATTQSLPPAAAFNLLTGVMDVHDNRIPIVNVFGRMGESNLLNQMTGQINNALASGQIAKNATPAQIFSQVVTPWLNSKGATIGPETGGAQLQGVLTNLIAHWQNGSLTNATALDRGGQKDTTLPAFGATPAAAATPTVTPRGAAAAGGGRGGSLNVKKLAAGGDVSSEDFGEPDPESTADVAGAGLGLLGKGAVASILGSGKAILGPVAAGAGAAYGALIGQDASKTSDDWRNAVNNVNYDVPLNATGDKINDAIAQTISPVGRALKSLANTASGGNPQVSQGLLDVAGLAGLEGGAKSFEGGELASLPNEIHVPSSPLAGSIKGRTFNESEIEAVAKAKGVSPDHAYQMLGDAGAIPLRHNDIDYGYSQHNGNHRQVESPNGYTTYEETPNSVHVTGTFTSPTGRGMGENEARIGSIVDYAHDQGKVFASDNHLSPSAVPTYLNLSKDYDVVMNDSRPAPAGVKNGYLVGEYNAPVFEVYPKGTADPAALEWTWGAGMRSPTEPLPTGTTQHFLPSKPSLRGTGGAKSFTDAGIPINTQFAKGGSVTPMVKLYKQFLKAKGYADGGDVSNDSADENQQPLSDTAMSTTSEDSSAPSTAGSQLQTVTSALLSKFGLDPSGAGKIVDVLHTLNPGVSDDDLLKNLGTNLPTVLSAAMRGNVQGAGDLGQIVNHQSDVNAQRTAAAKAVAGNMSHFGGDIAMAKLVGAGSPERAALEQENVPNIPVNAAQQNVENLGKTQNQALVNQTQQGLATQQAAAGQSAQAKAVQDQITSAQQTRFADPNSVQSRHFVDVAQNVLRAHGAPAAVISGIAGQSAIDATKLVDSFYGNSKQGADIKAAIASAAASQAAAFASTQQGRVSRVEANLGEQAVAQRGINPNNNGGGPAQAPIATAPTAPTAGAPTAQGGGVPQGQVNSVDALPQRPQLPAKFSGYRSPADLNNEQSNEQFANSLNEGSVNRKYAEEALDGMITSARGMIGPTGYIPTGQDFIKRFDPNRQQFKKFFEQYVAGLSAGATNQGQSVLASGVPSYETFTSSHNIVKDLLQLKARLIKADYLNQGLQERGRSGDLADAQPGNTYAGMKTYEFKGPRGTIQRVYNMNNPVDKNRLALDALNAKKEGAQMVQMD